MNAFSKLVWLVALLAVSFSSYAIDFQWSSPAGDKSIQFLGALFGPVGNVLDGPTSGLIGNVVQIFNFAILALGSIVVSYTIIVSTMNTAQEGEVMGRKWSSAWIPLRAAIGAGMLIPAPTFSVIQILFMNITIMGIHAANQIWAIVMDNYESGGGIYAQVDDGAIKSASLQILNTLVCQKLVNKSLPGLNFSTNSNAIMWYSGLNGSSTFSDFCGGLFFPIPLGPQYTDWVRLSIESAESILDPVADEIANDINNSGNTWTHTGAMTQAIRAMRSTILSAPDPTPASSSTTSDVQEALNNGWLYAGSYYFVLTKSDSQNSVSFPIPTAIPGKYSALAAPLLGSLGNQASPDYAHFKIPLAIITWLGWAGELTSGEVAPQPTSLSIQKPSIGNSQATSFMNKIAGPLQSLADKFMHSMTEHYADPLASIRKVGADIMVTCEDIWFAIIVIAFVLLIAGCTMSGMQPLCWAIGVVGTILMPILSFMLSLLWVIGSVMGIYTPMVPYLVFTFTALGWFILVIETIVAAPIVAMGIVSPAHEVLGKAAPAVMLITGVFLRPSLMVIGFIGSILLLKTIITMINYGFSATLNASVQGVGVFGVIAVVCLYGGLVLAVVHECFSLVYVLPDKILRWIGGQAEQSSVSQNVKEAEKSVQKGAEVGSGIMKGTAQMATDKVTQKAVDMNAPGGGGGMKGMMGGGGGGGGGMSF